MNSSIITDDDVVLASLQNHRRRGVYGAVPAMWEIVT
jgi:hypothetical protein